MRLPVSWLRDFVDGDASPGAIAGALTARGFTVDAVHVQPTPERIVVGRIETLARHPNADKLQVSSVDVGAEKLQIVTGATNVAVGDSVPIALVGAVVFTGASTPDGARATKSIANAKLRGVESVGMMCSAIELALPGEFPDGILILDRDAPIGTDFWRAVRFGDAVLDVDVPSNRADCLSVIGLAREAAAGLGEGFREPQLAEGAGAAPCPIFVSIEDPGVCRRLLGQCFTQAKNGPAPMWMTLRLHAAGVRSLDLLVDVSNYVQIETGQPLHFYDAARLRGGKIVARSAVAGERVVTLDGIERVLEAGVPVMADGERVVGVAGIFGGADAGVKADTVDVFLESPNFVGSRIRRAAIALGLRTEGATRHERGLPLELPELGRRRAAALLMATGAKPSTVAVAGEAPGPARSFDVRPARINALLGTGFSADEMSSALAPIGIEATGREPLRVTVPWWRPDLAVEVDIAEEVARSRGFDDIQERRSAAAPQSIDESLFDQENSLAHLCAGAGYREIVSIALQGTRAVEAWERSGLRYWTPLATVANPLSDDQRFLRPSLLPGLVAAASRAWPTPDGTLRLFETGHVFRPGGTEPAEETVSHDGMYAQSGVLEWPSLCGIACFASPDESGSVDRRLLAVKGDAERLIAAFTVSERVTVPHERSYLHPGAAADLTLGGKTVGKFGRLHPRLAKAFDLPATSYAFMLYLENLPRVRPIRAYVALPRFPGTRRDIAVVVDAGVDAGHLTDAVRAAGAAAFESVRAFDEYVGPQVEPGKKSVALAVMLRHADATITDAEADKSMEVIVGALRERYGASLRGPQNG
jgi:phenylalanyl-tRNA synthetase beta chain